MSVWPGARVVDTSRFQSYGYGADAKSMALKQLFSIAHQQGIVMAFSDVFLALTVLLATVALGTIVMKRPEGLSETPQAESAPAPPEFRAAKL